jgi:HK97 family phage major capsid protein
MGRLAEIDARLAEIASEVEKRGADMSAEDIAKRDAEVTALKAERIALIAANEQRTALLSRIADGNEAGAEAVRSFPSPATESGNDSMPDDPFGTTEYRRAFMAHVIRGAAIPAEYRADAITKTTDVGSVIPTTVLNKIIEKIEAVGMIIPLVTRTAYKGGLAIPTSSAKPVASWVAEGAGSDKQKKATGTLTFAYHKLRCAVAVSLEVDTMALSAFETTLINNVVTAMTKALEQAIISGNGTGKPKGILAETPATGQTINTAVPAYKNLIDAEAALPVEYENGTQWCMTKKTFMEYFGLQDETGQPIGRVNYGIGGKPERTLLGRPVVVCNYLDSFAPSLAAGKIFAFLFNFSDYVLNTNYAMGIKKYEDNATDDQITRAVMLADGKVVDKNSLVVISKQ